MKSNLMAIEDKGAEAGFSPWYGSAMEVVFPTSMTPMPLADFSIGQSDLLPSMGTVSLWSPDIRMFAKYEFEEPVSLALGGFDLSKAIIFILPLMLIVLAYDCISADKDAKRIGLMVAQGGQIKQIFWRRLLLRSTLVLGITLLVGLWALLQNTGSHTLAARLPYFVLWSISTLIYATFWVALIGFVCSKNRKGETNVMLLLLSWAGLSLIVPASITAIAEVAYPTPSRVAYLAEAREVENETELSEATVAQQFLMDHPDLAIDTGEEMPAYLKTGFLVTETVDASTKPILEAFEKSAQDREGMLNILSYLSPAALIQGLYNDISGTSSSRHKAYMVRAREYKAQFTQLAANSIVTGSRMTSANLDNLNEFKIQNEPMATIAERNMSILVFLSLIIGGLIQLTRRRLDKAKPL
jgi:ABC-2 type transport system permease protein